MIDTGYIVYLLLAAILVRFWWKIRGSSFDDLLADSTREHHQISRILRRHPQGGTWRELRSWIREDNQTQSYDSLYNRKSNLS